MYDTEGFEYGRKPDVDEERTETRLRGPKDQLAATNGDAADELRTEIDALEGRIKELAEFKSRASFNTNQGRKP